MFRRQLVIPDLSVLWVIFFVLVLTAITHRLLFLPLQRVMDARTKAIETARALAAKAQARAAAAAAEFDAKTGAARAEVYRDMDAARKAALDRRAELLALTRKEADDTRADAAARIEAATEAARTQLATEARTLSEAIVDRVLDRKAS
jgi:F0F1-type ATP synthase membrane subunit b/b'